VPEKKNWRRVRWRGESGTGSLNGKATVDSQRVGGGRIKRGPVKIGFFHLRCKKGIVRY